MIGSVSAAVVFRSEYSYRGAASNCVYIIAGAISEINCQRLCRPRAAYHRDHLFSFDRDENLIHFCTGTQINEGRGDVDLEGSAVPIGSLC